ncbi:MAG: malto-oligosyltrehalose trehalohydrolase [Gemmatimonadaceae bacterium]
MATRTRRPQPNSSRRRLPIGAECSADGAVHFRVWAPRPSRVEVVLYDAAARPVPDTTTFELTAEGGGYFSGVVPDASVGSLYRYRLDRRYAVPDPASRFQPDGPHGSSQIIDPDAFSWTDDVWRGIRLEGAVLYELHVGTFTAEGTWAAAAAQLPELADTGITCVEVMPVAEFPGRFGWGYDGVDLYAPTRLYGHPDDFRRFVDAAHGAGVAVILDVVYNHLGPDGNYLKEFSDHYFSKKHKTEWGEAFNFDAEHSAPVREFITANACYWVDEFHVDGLRLDATQSIFDDSDEHILTQIADAMRAAAGDRSVLLVGENEPQNTALIRPRSAGGCGLDALWNDDFHHTALVALTGKTEAYYSDYRATPQEFVSIAKHSYLYQGQYYRWQKKRRGTPTFGIAPARFVNFIENHDQLANSAVGARTTSLTSPGRHRAMTALLLLGPQTPMLFQGQEFAASTPFLFFADHVPEIAKEVRKGRADFLAQFPNVALGEVRSRLPDPADPATFARCKLNFAERERHADAYALHRDLLRLRRGDPVIRAQAAHGIDGAVLGPDAFVIRFFSDGGRDDRLLVVNLGRTLRLDPAPEPLLAPPPGAAWAILWTSDSPRYGGTGTPALEADRVMQGERREGSTEPKSLKSEPVWHLPGECAVLLAPRQSAR